MNTQTYTVNIRTGVVNITRVDVSQGDTGRTLAFKLYDGLIPFTPPTGSTVTIVGRKPSGLGFSETCTVSGNTAAVNTTLAMTQEPGKFPVELRIESDTRSIGTANFVMHVEPSPHPAGTTDGTLETMDDIQTQIGDLSDLTTSDKSSLVGAINEAAQSGGSEVVIDATLTQSGQAADAKATGDALAEIKADLEDLDDRVEALEGGSGGGLTPSIKNALLACFDNVAWKDTNGQTYYDDLYDALYAITAITLNTNSISMQTIGATSQLTATTTPAGGNVTWSSSNASVATVSSTGLVTSVAYGSATITATAGNVSATCSVVVAQATCTGITASYTQSGTVYSDNSLDSLKSDLAVTALYDNGTSQVLSDSDYTLTGNLDTATSIVTATFSGKTATFNVSVTLVGDVDYADDLANWFLTQVPGAASYSDGKITIKGSQSNADKYKLLCFDRAKTLWDTVNGKKLRIRVTMDSPDWVGAVGQQNRVIFGVSIYKNNAITTGNDRQKSQSLDAQILPVSTPTTYEFIFDADVSNFDTGDGTPTGVSTFGVFIYNVSANRLNITGCSVVEVLTS